MVRQFHVKIKKKLRQRRNKHMNRVEIDIKLLTKTAKIPTRGSSEAAGYDLYADIEKDIEIRPHTTEKIGTGIALAIPNGYFGGLIARSGLATKQGLRISQGLACVDADYRGEIFVPIHNDTDETQVIPKGTRIAQLVVIPFLPLDFTQVDKLDDTQRGSGGFGSTGTK